MENVSKIQRDSKSSMSIAFPTQFHISVDNPSKCWNTSKSKSKKCLNRKKRTGWREIVRNEFTYVCHATNEMNQFNEIESEVIQQQKDTQSLCAKMFQNVYSIVNLIYNKMRKLNFKLNYFQPIFTYLPHEHGRLLLVPSFFYLDNVHCTISCWVCEQMLNATQFRERSLCARFECEHCLLKRHLTSLKCNFIPKPNNQSTRPMFPQIHLNPSCWI